MTEKAVAIIRQMANIIFALDGLTKDNWIINIWLVQLGIEIQEFVGSQPYFFSIILVAYSFISGSLVTEEIHGANCGSHIVIITLTCMRFLCSDSQSQFSFLVDHLFAYEANVDPLYYTMCFRTSTLGTACSLALCDLNGISLLTQPNLALKMELWIHEVWELLPPNEQLFIAHFD
ncbi:hypothetical protein ACJX0J_020146 [Zea mays]